MWYSYQFFLYLLMATDLVPAMRSVSKLPLKHAAVVWHFTVFSC